MILIWVLEGNKYLRCYFRVIGLVACVVIISIRVAFFSLIVRQKSRVYTDKLVRFECGFDPIRRSRRPFSLRFFLLALLFLIFDLELVLLFPYVFRVIGGIIKIYVGCKVWILLFLGILVLGLLHELNEGRLSWDNE